MYCLYFAVQVNVFSAVYRTPDNSFHLPRSSRLDPNLQLNPQCPLGPQINVSKIQSNDHDQPGTFPVK